MRRASSGSTASAASARIARPVTAVDLRPSIDGKATPAPAGASSPSCLVAERTRTSPVFFIRCRPYLTSQIASWPMDRNLSWPTYANSTDSWLDPQAVAAIHDELPALADEIIRAIQREVPGYSRPLSGDFGRGIRSGTELALRRFIGTSGDESPGVYRSLGYGEDPARASL